MRGSAARFIDPGETIDAVMAARTRLPISLLIRYRMIVVANRRISAADNAIPAAR
jgi:hypothetical protein